MKAGLTLEDLINEVDRQERERMDFIIPQGEMAFVAAGPLREEALEFRGRAFSLTDTAHKQLATLAGVPQSFYAKMMDKHPDLHRDTVNRLLADTPDRKRMVRTLDGKARSINSDSYLRIDHERILEVVIPELEGLGFDVKSCNVDGESLFLKAFSPKLTGEISKGDIVQAGLTIRNNEVGQGKARVDLSTFRLVCTNGMIASTDMGGYSRRHLGGYVKADAEGIAESGSLDQVVLHLKESMALAITGFETLMEKLRATTTNVFAKGTDLEKLVQAMAKKHMPMSDLEAASVTHWLREEDETAFGMIQALTRHAQDAKTYQRATDFETFGGMILDFSPRQWNELQEMAKAA